MNQLIFADIELGVSRKPSRISLRLDKINTIVDWDKIYDLVKDIDYTNKDIGGRPPLALLSKIKMLFLQHLHNLSDPELEDQVNDRLSFQKFTEIDYSTSVPDYTTIWRFKERLIKHNLMDKLFELINSFIQAKSLFVKKGTLVDATIISSTNKPLSHKKREALEKNPSSQIDTDAHSTAKKEKQYFGYKGHIGTDMESDLIRKKAFTSAEPHDSQLLDELLSADERAVFGDSTYSNKKDKQEARKNGVYYGMLDKGTRKRKLSSTQKQNNTKKSKTRANVEHPFAYMKEKLNYRSTVAKTIGRNDLGFTMNCILYNIYRANHLLLKQS